MKCFYFQINFNKILNFIAKINHQYLKFIITKVKLKRQKHHTYYFNFLHFF